jgi:phage shock protein E
MKLLRIAAAAVLLVLGTLGAESFAAGKNVTAPAVIIDVRSEAEWNEGHLEGAVLIPYDRIETGITAMGVDKKTRIFLYCRSGRRTGIAFDALKKIGYDELINLETLENASKTLNRAIVK